MVHERGEILALHELHREEQAVALLADVEDAANGRVRDPPRQPYFVAQQDLGRGRRRSDEFERDRHAEHQVVGAPDIAHAAAAETRDHPIAAGEHLAGRKRFRGDLRRRGGRAARVVVRGEERLHVGEQRVVVPGGQPHERRPLGDRPFERSQKQIFRTDRGRRHRRESTRRRAALSGRPVRAESPHLRKRTWTDEGV